MMKKTSQLTVWMCTLAAACAAEGATIRVGDGGGNPDFVEGTWPAGSVVEVVADIAVGKGTSLTIEEGTIVRFAPNASLLVQSTAELTVSGTAERPVRLTSLQDRTGLGGDDRDAGLGDWEGIAVAGHGSFLHAEVLHGGVATQGLLTVRSGGAVEFRNGLVAYARQNGVLNAGTLLLENSVIADANTGLYLYPSRGGNESMARCVNSIIHHTTLGVMQKGGDGRFLNCIVSDYRRYGASYLDGDVQFDRCDFHSEQDGSMMTATPMEATRTMEEPPRYVDADAFDFRLTEGSALIDAGEADGAPERDAWGNPRVNAPGVEPTGTPTADGSHPDIGIHEWQPDYTTNNVDVTVKSVTIEESFAMPCGTIHVNWVLANEGTEPFSGTWKDVLTFVPEYGAEVRLGELESTGTLAGGEETTCSGVFRVPAVANRLWRVRVDANDGKGVFESKDAYGNNSAESREGVAVAAETLGLGQWVYLEPGETQVWRPAGIDEAGQVLNVLSSSLSEEWSAVGAFWNVPPEGQAWPSVRDGTNLWLSIPASGQGTPAYLVLRNEGTSGISLMLQGLGPAMNIVRLDREAVRISPNTSVTAEGVGLAQGVTGLLKHVQSGTVLQTGLGGWSDVLRYGIFDLSGAETGAYNFGIANAEGTTVWAETEIEVAEAETGGQLTLVPLFSDVFHPGDIYMGSLSYRNSGDADLALPGMVVEPKRHSDTEISTGPTGPFETNAIVLYGVSPTEPACILKPGEYGEAVFYYRAESSLGLTAENAARTVHYLTEQFPFKWQKVQDEMAAQEAQRQAEQVRWDNQAPAETESVSLEEMGTLSGRLVEVGTDNGLEGIPLILYCSEKGVGPKGPVTTAADGSFLFTNLPTSGSFSFYSPEAEVDRDAEATYPEGSLDITGVVLEAERLFEIRGIVTAGGEGLPGATVVADNGKTRRETVTEIDGGYSFRGVTEDAYTVTVEGTGGYAGALTTNVTFDAVTHVAIVDAVLEPGVVWRGNLVPPEGSDASLAGVPVQAIPTNGLLPPETVFTDGTGHFEFPGLAAGTTYLFFVGGRWESAEDAEEIETGPVGSLERDLQVRPTVFFQIWPPVGQAPMEVGVEIPNEDLVPEGTVGWAWDFDGDGETDSTEAWATHTYETGGVYSVQLTLTDSRGRTTTYRVDEAVQLIDEPVCELNDTVILLGETNADYRFVGAVSNAAGFHLMVRQLTETPGQPMQVGSYLAIEAELEDVPNICQVVSCSKEGDVWNITVAPVEDMLKLFRKIEGFIYPMADGEPQAGPQHRRAMRRGGNSKSLVNDGGVTLTFDYSLPTKDSLVAAFNWDEDSGIKPTIRLYFSHNFEAGLHLTAKGEEVKPSSPKDKEIELQTYKLEGCLAGSEWLKSGIFLYGALKITAGYDYSFSGHVDIDCNPKVSWLVELGYDNGQKKTPKEPKCTISPNKWEIAGNGKAHVYLKASIEGGVTAKIANCGDDGNVAKLSVWGEAGPELSFSASDSQVEANINWKASCGITLSFLSFLGEWAPSPINLAEGPGASLGALKMPAWVAKGVNISCKDFLSFAGFEPGALLGAMPNFSMPGGLSGRWGSPDLSNLRLTAPSGWSLPKAPKFKGVSFKHGEIPKFSGIELPSYKTWEWDWMGFSWSYNGFDFNSDNFLNLDIKGLAAAIKEHKFPSIPNLRLPTLEGVDLDDLQCYTLPDLSLAKMALKVTGFRMPSASASLPDWAKSFANLPVEAYLDWGDGQKSNLDINDVEGSLRNLADHQYSQPGIYVAKLGVKFKYVNSLDKDKCFLIVVPNNDWDGDGMPNMWEMAFSAGLNPLGADGGSDWDGDGLSNYTEFILGTNPLNDDSDGDGMPDGFEAMYIDQAGGKPGLKIWENDAKDDCDNDGLNNIDEYKGGPENNPVPDSRRGIENQQRDAKRGGGDQKSLNPVDKDTDNGGVADGEEIEMGTDPFFDGDDKKECDCGQHAVRGDDGLYVCENDDAETTKCSDCEHQETKTDENGCTYTVCVSDGGPCPDDDDDDDPGGCLYHDPGHFRYTGKCANGLKQSAGSDLRFWKKVKCGTGGWSGGGSYGIGGVGGGSTGTKNENKKDDDNRKECADLHKDDPDPTDPNPNPTPNGDPGSHSQHSAVYLVMGDYIDNETDLPVRMGGTTAGLKRYLRNNEWTFREAASGLSLAPGAGAEGEVATGTGTLGVEWNGSGAPGAAAALTNEATGVSLESVPTGLWGPWAGTTQVLVRVEYGVVRTNGTVGGNYGELVKAWRAAVEAGNTGTAAGLEATATNGVVRVTAAVDAEGRRTTYDWNGAGLMTAAHFADGTQETYEYGSDGLMSGKTMQDGEHVGLKHDNFGYLTGYNDMKYEYSYDGGTKTFYTTLRYPDGRVGERWYNGEGKLFRHAMNGGVVFDEATVKADVLLTEKPAWPKEVLNDAELPVTVEYRSGAAEAFAWDGPGYARTHVTEATGEELAWTYDAAGREMSETREGVARNVERDSAGQVTRERLASSSGTAEADWAWDAAGNATEGRMGGWGRTNTYDLAGRVMTAAGADGGMWAFTRDAEGRATAWTQPDGESGEKTYDARGRMTWRKSPGGVETWWWHATNGLLAAWSNSLGRMTTYQYDRGGRVAKETDEAGDVVAYEYDSAGNWRGLAPELRTFVNDGEGGLVLAVTNGGRVMTARRLWGTWLLRGVQANDQAWRLERNEEGQVTGLVRAPTEGNATTNLWSYDAAGRLAGWTDATGVSASRGYDAAGFVAWETNGAGGVRRWSHDGTGRLTEVTDAAERTSVFAYEPVTGTTTATLADGSQTELRTDAWGREIGRTDAAGTVIATERRFDGAVLRRTWTAAGEESAGLEATWTRDGDGRLVRQKMAGGPATRTEWIGGNRCERTVTEFGAFEAGTAVQHDAAGRVTAVQGADGEWAECVYGDDGEVSGWMLPEGSVWFARDLVERTRTTMLPSEQMLTERVDLSGRVTNAVLADADGTVAWSLSLARDAAGRIVGQGAETLEWDGAERVVSAGGTAYARDAAGNRSGSGWTTEGMDRLTAWPGGTYGYDTNGAVVSRTSATSVLRFVRDLAGRVTEIRNGSDGLVVRFAYDAEGRRLSKETGPGTRTCYLWSGDRLAAELSETGTVERVYGYWTEDARSPDWVRAGGELYVVLKDGFGAAAALVAVSDGTVTAATPGTVFGEGWACLAMPVWADGLLADAETGLLAGLDGRLYDPATGRWLSPTPGAVEAGLNLYAREPSSTGFGREFPGLSMPGVAPEYDVVYVFARRCGADAETAAALARAELLLGLEGRSDAAARRWVRLRDEATAAAGLRLLGGVPADMAVCARKGVESFLKARRDVLEVTTELDAYGKLRSAMDLEEAFRLELAWSGEAEERAAMGAWRGTWGWAGLRPEGADASERWLALLLQAGNGERLSEETLEWLGEAKLLALSDWERPVTASLDAEKMRETAAGDMAELRRVLQAWAKECE